MALEQALAEQQKQRGACGLCAPCLFPPCANITQRCPRESHLTPPQPYPILYRSYPGNIPHSCQPYRLCQNTALSAKDPTETLPSDSTQADPHPLEILPKLKPYPKHCQTLSSHPKYFPPKKHSLSPYPTQETLPKQNSPTVPPPHPPWDGPGRGGQGAMRMRGCPRHHCPCSPCRATHHAPQLPGPAGCPGAARAAPAPLGSEPGVFSLPAPVPPPGHSACLHPAQCPALPAPPPGVP